MAATPAAVAAIHLAVLADHGPDAKAWLKDAETHDGSWWPDVSAWLDERCGELKPAPKELGSTRLQPLDDAPGTYVFDK
jgi:polyhydroxyalkanoate synthase